MSKVTATQDLINIVSKRKSNAQIRKAAVVQED